MTIEQAVRAYLESYGVWGFSLDAIIAQLKTEQPAMAGRWEESQEEYPSPLLRALEVHAKATAIEWTEQNKPKAFWLYALKGA